MRFVRTFLLSVAASLLASASQAALVLDFSSDGGLSFANSLIADADDTLTVSIFARQTGTSTQLSEHGLISMGFLGRFDATKASILSASINDSFSSNSEIDFSSVPGELLLAGTGPLVAGRAVAAKGESILLGEFTFQVITSNFSFAFGDRDRDFGIDGNFEDMVQDTEDPNAGNPIFPNLDPIFFGADIQTTHGLTITSAIPEPSVAIVWLYLAMWLPQRRFRSTPTRS